MDEEFDTEDAPESRKTWCENTAFQGSKAETCAALDK
jgi:hypothetical protein